MKKIILLFLGLIFSYCFQNLNAQIAKNKIAGVCFRVDDQQSVSNWNDYSAVFSKYNLNFCLSQNLDIGLADTSYFGTIRNLTNQGNEFLDHSPSHTMVYITMQNYADTIAYSGNPYVDHIKGKKVYFIQGDVVSSIQGNGLANLVNGNMLISQNNGGFKGMGTDSNPYIFGTYLSGFNSIFTLSQVMNYNSNDPDTIILRSYWDEPLALPDKANISFNKLNYYDLKIPIGVRKLLAERTLYLANKYNLPTPKTIILPGGSYAVLKEDEIKEVWGDLYNYTSGNSKYDYSNKCYNEYDPNKLARWGVTWGDFYEESTPFSILKNTIANNIAKHNIQIGQSHFTGLLGGWTGYIARMDSLLNWLKVNNIPVKTYKQWTDILHDSIPNPYVNIFPSLGVDLDNDGLPDGYYSSNLDTTDGVASSNYKCSNVNGLTGMFEVQHLAGLEIGTNCFSAYTKGSPGDSIMIIFSGGAFPLWESHKIPADQPNWTRYSIKINIPDSLNKIFVSATVSDYNSGNVKVSGMEMRKLSTLKLHSITGQKINANKSFMPVDLKQLVIDPIYNPTNISFSYSSSNNLKFTIDTNKILSITKINPFWIGKDSVLITGANPDNTSDSIYLTFEAIQPEICYGDSIILTADSTASLIWTSIPIDSSMTNVSNYNQVLYPKTSTVYQVSSISQSGDTNLYQLSILVHQLPVAKAGNDLNVCYNDSIKLTASGGVDYIWNNGVVQNQYFQVTNQGYYIVKVIDENGCFSKDSLYLTVYPIPNVGVFDTISPICFNNSTTLKINNASGDFNWQVLTENQWTDIINANLSTYTTPLLTSNKYYRIKTSNTNCTVYSSQPLTVIVDPIIEAGYIYSNSQVCIGSPTTIAINGNNGNVEWQSSLDGLSEWTTIGNSDKNTPNFITPPLYNIIYFRAKVSNDNCGEAYTNIIGVSTKQPSLGGNINLVSPVCNGGNSNLTLYSYLGNIQWQESTDKGNTWSDILSDTLPQITTPPIINTTYYRAKVSYQDCPSSYSNIDSVLVDSISLGGFLSGVSPICQGSNTSLTLSNYRGNIQWQQSLDTLNWQNVTLNSFNNIVYTGYLNTSTYFRTSVINGSCQAATSNVVKINVDSMSTGGNAIANSPVCYGSSSYVNLIGYFGNIQWQYSWDAGITWTNFTKNTTENSPQLNLTNQTSTEYFRASVKNGVCPVVYSIPDTILVNNHSVGGTVGTIAPICQGKTTNCYLYSYTGNIQWQQSVDTIIWNDVTTGINYNAWNYTTPALNSSLYYRAKLTNGVCPTVYSTYKPVVVNPVLIPSVSINIINSNNPQYSPADSVSFNASITNGGTTPVYKWLKNGTTVGINNSSYTYIPTNGDQITCQITSNALCASTTNATSNSITMSVNNNPVSITGTIDAVTPICYNTSTLLHISNCIGNMKWQQLIGNIWTDIPDAISAYYQISLLANTTQFRVAVSYSNYPVYYLSPVTVTVYPPTVGGILSSIQSVCNGSSVSLSLSGHNGNIEWQASNDGLVWNTIGVSSINNPVFSTSPLFNNTYFRAKVINGNCEIAYSNIDSVTVTQSSFNGSINAVSPVCSGTNSILSLADSFNNIQWQTSFDKNTWSDITNANNQQLITDPLFKNTYYRAKISTIECPLSYSNIDSVLVDSLSIGGFLSGTATICQGSITTLNISNYKGSIQWQQSLDTLSWQNVTLNSVNNIVYTSYLNTSTYFRTSVINGSCQAATSNVVKISVDSMSTGGIAIANSPVCYGDPTTVSLNAYYGNIQWQVSWDNASTWTNISSTNTSAKSPQLNLINQTTTQLYRATVKNGVCPFAYSVFDTVQVDNHAIGGTVGTIAPICQGKATNCYLYNYSGNIQWQQSVDTILWTDVTSGVNYNAWNYTSPNLNNSIYYRAKLTNGVCPVTYSTYKPVVVNTIPTPSVSINIINGNNPQYAPADSVTFNAIITNGGTTPVYKWVKNGSTVSTNSPNYVYIPANGDQITCQITSNASCATITSATSNSITMSVNNNPASITGTLDAVTPICYNTSTLLHISNCIGNIQWQQFIGTIWTDIPNAISAYYQTSPLANTTQFRVAVSYSNYPVYYLSPVTVTVYPPTAGGSLSSIQTICSVSKKTHVFSIKAEINIS